MAIALNHKHLCLATTAAALLSLLAGCLLPTPDADTPNPTVIPPAIAAAGRLRVGIVTDRAPYLFADDTAKSGFSGLEMKLLDALSADTGMPLQLRPFATETDMFAGLRAGDVDLAVPAATDGTILRHFHTPCARHLPTGQRYVVRREAAAFLADPHQLDRPEIVALTVVDTVGAEMCPHLLPRADQETLPSLAAALDRLGQAEGGVLVTDARTAWTLTREPDSRWALVFGVNGPEQLAWAVRSDDIEWQAYLDHFMAGVRVSGRFSDWVGEFNCNAVHAEPGRPGN
jgi:ABC-type amino acid transport substrate-binding protein